MYTMYCYSKCSTCRDARKWLDDAGVAYQVIDLVQDTPTAAKFSEWMSSSEQPIRRFFNTSGMKYRELGLKDKVADLTISEAADILASDGMLVKRPLIIKDNRFVTNGFKAADYEGAVK